MMSSQVPSNADNSNGTASPISSCKSNRWRTTTALLKCNEKIERHFPKFVFDPDSSVVCYWTAIVSMATLYNAWMIALRIAFPEIRDKNSITYITYLDSFSDLIYLMDILVQLRTAYLQDGIPVFDPSKIRQQYISQTYFLRDLLSILPTQTLLSLLPESVGFFKYFLCTAGAARLIRLLKFHVIYRFYDLAESLTSNPHLIRVLRLFLNLAVIIHWIACLYYLLSEFEGLGSNAWVYTNSTGQQRFTRKYIICLYWSAMTLTTIGNTHSPETDIEYIFTGVIFLTGVFVFATVMGNVGDVISSMNANRQEFQARMDHIKMYLTHKKVPASLQLKIKKWAEYTWSRTKATDESRLLNMLPERLRAEVAVHVHLDSLKKVKIFEQCETGFLCELVLKLRSQVFSPGDYVCRAGETGREMFIINHGKVEVLVPSSTINKDMVVAVLSEGNYFGEISLLRLDGVENRRTADVRSIGYAELLCLSRRDLMTALVEYPEAKYVLESQAKKRMKTNLQAQKAFSVDTLSRNSQDQSSIDSGTASKDETRGHNLNEIKTMIEDLKNSNKVSGRTVWQLIIRCEVLQAKVIEKERENEDLKERVKDLVDLFASRHIPNQQLPLSNDTPLDADRHLLRPNSKVVKQFSQDEGRNWFNGITEEELESSNLKEKLTIPDVTISSPPPSDNGFLNGEGSNSQRISALQDNNFIKTSKITHVKYDNNSGINSNINIRFIDEDNQDDTATFGNSVLSKDSLKTSKHEEIECEDFTKTVEISSERKLSFQPNSSYSNGTSYHHKVVLKNFEGVSFTSSYETEISLSDPFDVQTIPEEDEDVDDDMDKNKAEASSSDMLGYALAGNSQDEINGRVSEPSQSSILNPVSTTKFHNAKEKTDSQSEISNHNLRHSPPKKTLDCKSIQSESRESSAPLLSTANDSSWATNKPIESDSRESSAPLLSTVNDPCCATNKPMRTYFKSIVNGNHNSSMDPQSSKIISFDKASDSTVSTSKCDTESQLLSTNATRKESLKKLSDLRRILSRSKSKDDSGSSQNSTLDSTLHSLFFSLEREASSLSEIDGGISFLRMGSLSRYLSEESSSSRRNSWNWDSEYETEEETSRSDK